MFELLYFLPKNLISYLFGLLSMMPLPISVREPLYTWYGKRYHVEMTEVELPLAEYHSLQAFFTRNLKPGSRTIGQGVVSPVDGSVEQTGELNGGVLIQAKGKQYSLAQLLQSNELAARFSGGSYATLYLAPGDYHHIHSPVDGEISTSVYVPGALWPVNEWSVETIDNLFVKNERVITIIESAKGAFALVKVGATNVGSIRTTYNDFRGNPFSQIIGPAPSVLHQSYAPTLPVQKGSRIGSFFLGSTVVLLSETRELVSIPSGKIRYGQSLFENLANKSAGVVHGG